MTNRILLCLLVLLFSSMSFAVDREKVTIACACLKYMPISAYGQNPQVQVQPVVKRWSSQYLTAAAIKLFKEGHLNATPTTYDDLLFYDEMYHINFFESAFVNNAAQPDQDYDKRAAKIDRENCKQIENSGDEFVSCRPVLEFPTSF